MRTVVNQLEAKAAALEAEAAALEAEAAEVRKLANEAEATEPDIETTLAVELTRTNRLRRPKPDETSSSTMFYSSCSDERESAEREPSDTASPMELAVAPATEAGASADKYRQHPRTLLPPIPGKSEIWNRIPGNFPGDSTPAHPDSRPP